MEPEAKQEEAKRGCSQLPLNAAETPRINAGPVLLPPAYFFCRCEERLPRWAWLCWEWAESLLPSLALWLPLLDREPPATACLPSPPGPALPSWPGCSAAWLLLGALWSLDPLRREVW